MFSRKVSIMIRLYFSRRFWKPNDAPFTAPQTRNLTRGIWMVEENDFAGLRGWGLDDPGNVDFANGQFLGNQHQTGSCILAFWICKSSFADLLHWQLGSGVGALCKTSKLCGS